MARIGALVVICLVTSDTRCGGGAIIAACVAVNTSCRCVCPCQRPDGGMVKSRRYPSRLTMALCTIRGELIGKVARVGRCIIVRLVAGHTRGGCTGVVAANVTDSAIIGNGFMCPCEWPYSIVVKGRGCPACLIMALCTVGWQLIGSMMRCGGTIKIRPVTTHAGIGCVVIVASGMAFCAIIGNGRVCPLQYIIIIVDGERCRCPPRHGGVAHRAIRGDAQGHMVGIAALIVIRQVAGCTLGGSALKTACVTC